MYFKVICVPSKQPIYKKLCSTYKTTSIFNRRLLFCRVKSLSLILFSTGIPLLVKGIYAKTFALCLQFTNNFRWNVIGVQSANVTLSQSSPSAVLQQEFTFTCSYSEGVFSVFEWKRDKVTVGAFFISTCISLISVNNLLYSFTCPSNTTSTWTVKNASLEDHQTQWHCIAHLTTSNLIHLQVLGR